MSRSFERSNIWNRTLSTVSPYASEYPGEVGRLRQAFLGFRDRAQILAGEIAASLPDFTVHDLTHLDALWRMADLICGPDYPLNPCEAFILGGSFLLHDLGMALAAYPQGVDDIQKTPAWLDTVAALLSARLGRDPTAAELAEPTPDIRWKATSNLLRALHAQKAEELVHQAWTDRAGRSTFHLIEDVDLRATFATAIGKVARSHWWPVAMVRDKMSIKIGAPVGFPDEWSADLLSASCILRAADICHIDATRAPAFLKALRRPSGVADAHWTFQDKLLQPMRLQDRIVYTARAPFNLEESAAWWLCSDTLLAIDSELKTIDATLADTGRERFAVRSVAYANDIDQLVRHIPTAGWTPVDTSLRVSNLPALVKKLGGEQLYGDSIVAPIRELIQNGRDAIVARRLLEGRNHDWGRILVSTRLLDEKWVLEITDNGVGMSSAVLTNTLLDFGRSLWDSESIVDEFPGLLSKGFSHVGKYGIGFFSVFMLGTRIKVVTRRYDEAPSATRVLQFSDGLATRPILRQAEPSEILREGGTAVSVVLAHELVDSEGRLSAPKRRNWRYGDDIRAAKWTLGQLCAWTCPALDVDLAVDSSGVENTIVVSNDWLKISGAELLKRVAGPLRRGSTKATKSLKEHGDLVRPLTDGAGRIVGRACIYLEKGISEDGVDKGAIAVGGLRSCALRHMAGIVSGLPVRASRDVAIPDLPVDRLRHWATEQAESLACAKRFTSNQLLEAAKIVRLCEGHTGELPVVFTSQGYLTQEQLVQFCRHADELVVLSPWDFELENRLAPVRLEPNVILLEQALSALVILEHPELRWPQDFSNQTSWMRYFDQRTMLGAVVEAAAKAWDMLEAQVWRQCELPDYEENQEILVKIGESARGPLVLPVSVRIRRAPAHAKRQ